MKKQQTITLNYLYLLTLIYELSGYIMYLINHKYFTLETLQKQSINSLGLMIVITFACFIDKINLKKFTNKEL